MTASTTASRHREHSASPVSLGEIAKRQRTNDLLGAHRKVAKALNAAQIGLLAIRESLSGIGYGKENDLLTDQLLFVGNLRRKISDELAESIGAKAIDVYAMPPLYASVLDPAGKTFDDIGSNNRARGSVSSPAPDRVSRASGNHSRGRGRN